MMSRSLASVRLLVVALLAAAPLFACGPVPTDVGGVGGAAGSGSGGSAGAPDAGPGCGNGVIDPDRYEQCDGVDLGGHTCETFPHQPSVGVLVGTLRCKPNCEFDISDCHGCLFHRTVYCQ
jgi:hypothetical protein